MCARAPGAGPLQPCCKLAPAALWGGSVRPRPAALGSHTRSLAACRPAGLTEGEMVSLVHQKLQAGVAPPWEWAVVQR